MTALRNTPKQVVTNYRITFAITRGTKFGKYSAEKKSTNSAILQAMSVVVKIACKMFPNTDGSLKQKKHFFSKHKNQ